MTNQTNKPTENMTYTDKEPINAGVATLIKDLGWKFNHYTQSLAETTQQLEALASTSPAAAEAVALLFCNQNT